MSREDVSPTDPSAVAADSAADPGELEALACVSCRSRKLKCDRTKPACTRCARLKSECVYPESRRKPAFKRRNVKELEERLAQVEVLLKDASGNRPAAPGDSVPDAVFPDPGPHAAGDDAQNTSLPDSGFHGSGNPSGHDAAHDAFDWNFGAGGDGPAFHATYSSGDATNPTNPTPFSMPDMRHKPRAENAGATRNELLGLGLFEALPPTEMIEDLHHIYFTKQHPLIPIVHPGRYMQAFYSGPHLRPPMALSYAIWTMATNGHEEYAAYHDAFHRRARHYLAEDELRGEGEHFITVAHAQAWALISTDEARCMWFTRAAMSAASCIKLLHMMGLHRLDDPNAAFEMAPTIAPPRDWTELEERRRVFWGALCIDSHAAISTGWPCLIDMNDVTTHLPSSEEAFTQCREEETCRLEDVLTGASYSSFAGAAFICHIFNQILKHIHRSKPSDCPDNFKYGPYWNKHRELDNLLSSAFMFLPERFRLPKNVRDPVAVHTNLNLHASVVCLHNGAYEMANEHNLPDVVKQTSRTRLLTASQEIVNIVKLTNYSNAGFRSPLVALALYVASSVYITIAQNEGLEPATVANLEFLLAAMAAIGRQHLITKSFLRQAVLDLQRGGLAGVVRVPHVDMPLDPETTLAPCGGNIPLFARSRASRHTDIQPPLPGRLPLSNPIGRRFSESRLSRVSADLRGQRDGEEPGNASKRRRVMALSTGIGAILPGNDPALWLQAGPAEGTLLSDISTDRGGGQSRADTAASDTRGAPNAAQVRLAHRMGSSTGSSPSAAGAATAAGSTSTPASMTQPSSEVSPGTTKAGGRTNNTMASNEGVSTGNVTDAFGTMAGASQHNSVDLSMFQDLSAWDVTGDPAQDAATLYAEVTEAMQGGNFVASSEDDSWMVLNEVGAVWDTGQGPGGER